LKLFRKLQKLIHQKNKEVLSRFKEIGIPNNEIDSKYIVQPLENAKEEYAKIIAGNTKESITRGVLRTIENLQKSGYMEKARSPIPKIDTSDIFAMSEGIWNKVYDHVFEASEATMDRIVGNVMSNLADSYEAGLGYDEAARELSNEFVNMETYELERVARTEIASMENLGSFEMDKELGVEYHKWKTAGDERVRDSHDEMDGEITKVGNIFSNQMLYPGDRNAPLEEWINCRCITIPFIIPEGMMAPQDMDFFMEDDLVAIDTPTGEIPSAEPTEGESTSIESSTDYQRNKELEEYLQKHEITKTEDLSAGVNESIIVEYADGTKGIHKPIAGEIDWMIDDLGRKGTLAARERMAYVINREMGDSNVPVTIFKEVDNKAGSLQKWANDYVFKDDIMGQIKRLSETERDLAVTNFRLQEAKMHVFDYLIQNADRHEHNYLVNIAGDIKFIDNGYSLPNRAFTYGRDVTSLTDATRMKIAIEAGKRRNELTIYLKGKEKVTQYRDSIRRLVNNKAIKEEMKNNNMGGAEYTFFNERVKALLDSLNGYLRDNY